jgi:hypothetical protein
VRQTRRLPVAPQMMLSRALLSPGLDGESRVGIGESAKHTAPLFKISSFFSLSAL